MVNHIAMVLRYRVNTSSQLDSSRFTNRILSHSLYFDMHRFTPFGAGCPVGPLGTTIVAPSAKIDHRSDASVVGGRRLVDRIVLDASVPPVTHGTLGMSILHCSRPPSAGEK